MNLSKALFIVCCVLIALLVVLSVRTQSLIQQKEALKSKLELAAELNGPLMDAAVLDKYGSLIFTLEAALTNETDKAEARAMAVKLINMAKIIREEYAQQLTQGDALNPDAVISKSWRAAR